jgi:hypothetical protein
VAQLNESLLQNPGLWLAANGSGHLERSLEFNSLTWLGLPFLAPNLRSEGDFVFGEFFPNAGRKRALPDELLQPLGETNLFYSDWEITSPRVSAWFYISQTLRVVLRKSQLPAQSVAMSWLKTQTNTLGQCTTAVFESGPEQLACFRRSSIGFTAFELHLLADWLESPQFPRGLNTFFTPLQTARGRKRPPQSPSPPPR